MMNKKKKEMKRRPLALHCCRTPARREWRFRLKRCWTSSGRLFYFKIVIQYTEIVGGRKKQVHKHTTQGLRSKISQHLSPSSRRRSCSGAAAAKVGLSSSFLRQQVWLEHISRALDESSAMEGPSSSFSLSLFSFHTHWHANQVGSRLLLLEALRL